MQASSQIMYDKKFCGYLPGSSMRSNAISHEKKVYLIVGYFVTLVHGSFETPYKAFCESVSTGVIR